MRFPRTVSAALVGWLVLLAATSAAAQSVRGPVEGHDNRRPAGIVADGTLTVRIYAGRGDWRPEEGDGPALTVAASARREARC